MWKPLTKQALEECVNKILMDSPLQEQAIKLETDCKQCSGYDPKCDKYKPIREVQA
jgi:hypothetical protein